MHNISTLGVPFGTAQKRRKGRRGIVDVVLAISLRIFHALELSLLLTVPFPRFPGPRIDAIFPSLRIYPEESLPYKRVIAVDEELEEFLSEPDLATHQYNAFSDVKSGELSRRRSGGFLVQLGWSQTLSGLGQAKMNTTLSGVEQKIRT